MSVSDVGFNYEPIWYKKKKEVIQIWKHWEDEQISEGCKRGSKYFFKKIVDSIRSKFGKKWTLKKMEGK